MADPTDIDSQMVFEKLVNLGIQELRCIYLSKDRGKAMGDYLGIIGPLFDDAAKAPLAGISRNI